MNQSIFQQKTRWMVIVVLLCAASMTSAEGAKKRIKFPKGFSGVTLQGGVIRGDRDEYLLKAGKGQTLTVKITSLENNAVFQIYAPNRKTLKGAGEGEDVRNWKGKLPLTGDYRIIVGGTRGNASYSLSVTVE
ncbi:MAG: hypothetical protein HY231_12705 [Acidobacteria bacterium]|nr:hypothetical protein [Acidobacteriota bacterium]